MFQRFSKSAGSQSLYLAGASAASQLILALMFLVTAREMTPTAFGAVVTGISIATVAAGFIDFGSNALWVREVTGGRMQLADLARNRSGKILLAAGAGTLWLSATFVGLLPEFLWIAAPIAACTVISQASQVVLRVQVRSDLVGVATVIDRVLALVAFAGLGMFGIVGYGPALWISMCSGMVAGSFASYFLSSREYQLAFRFSRPSNPYRDAGYYGIASIASSAQSLDMIIINSLSGSAAAGSFGAVNRWTQPLGLLVSSFAQASMPFVARSGTWSKAWSHVRGAIWMPIMAIVGCIAIVFAAPTAVTLLLGTEYSGSVSVLQLLALAVIPAIVSQPTLIFLQALGYDRPASTVMWTVVVIQLCGVLAAAPRFGAAGAAFAILCGQLLMMTGLLLIARGAGRAGRTSQVVEGGRQ